VAGPSEASPDPVRLTFAANWQGIERLRACIAALQAFEPSKVQRRWSPDVMRLQEEIEQAIVGAFEYSALSYGQYRAAAKLDNGRIIGHRPLSLRETQNHLVDGKKRALQLLSEALRKREEELKATSRPKSRGASQVSHLKIFIVHGHDKLARLEVARFLTTRKFDVKMLDEEHFGGGTVIENFVAVADGIDFAVVVLTPDDVGGSVASAHYAPRARQNVIFELGYFVGKLGRDRACLLRKGDIDIPSDLYGVLYIDMDDKGGWKFKLVQELEAVQGRSA
jgi:predicted nucleotide-binding protein